MVFVVAMAVARVVARAKVRAVSRAVGVVVAVAMAFVIVVMTAAVAMAAVMVAKVRAVESLVLVVGGSVHEFPAFFSFEKLRGNTHHGQLGISLAFPPLLFSVQSYGLYAI